MVSMPDERVTKKGFREMNKEMNMGGRNIKGQPSTEKSTIIKLWKNMTCGKGNFKCDNCHSKCWIWLLGFEIFSNSIASCKFCFAWIFCCLHYLTSSQVNESKKKLSMVSFQMSFASCQELFLLSSIMKSLIIDN